MGELSTAAVVLDQTRQWTAEVLRKRSAQGFATVARGTLGAAMGGTGHAFALHQVDSLNRVSTQPLKHTKSLASVGVEPNSLV